MEELKRRILSDAVVGEGDIIHVDMFLNHCMDINLMEHMGNALAKRFRGVRITKVLTAESSGIALACFVARALDVPAVYAKKFQTGYIDPEVYSAETHSFSLEKSYTLRVSKKYLDGDDVVLLVDDILSIKTYYEQQWLDRGLNIKYIKFVCEEREQLVEPEVEIEYDPYRSFNRSKRSALASGK